jgi:peptidoglycan/LPS O-acetylase OafA/YrhL
VNDEGRKAAIPHISALDGARGLAVAGVLLFHGGHLTGGYLGVDFFFTLSGFLITSLLLAESSRTDHVGLGGFWSRRARRLLPALTLLMLGIGFYCVVFASQTQLYQIRGDALATLGYVANWRQIFSHQDYFALFTSPSPLDHTWSLAIEEQFYLIWPLVFVGLLAWWRGAVAKAVLVTSLVLAGISSVLMFELYNPANVARAYFGTDTRAASILFGAALAAWLAISGPTRNRRRRFALEAVGVLSAVGLAVAWTRLDGQSSTLYRGGFLFCGLAATAVIAAAVHPDPGPVSRFLSLRPLCALGLISYGVYLYHWPIDVALNQQQMGFGGWPLFAFQTAVTLAVAVASYRIVEQPIRHGALSSVQWRKVTPAVAIGLVVVIFATTWGAPSVISFYKHPIGAARHAAEIAPKGSLRVMLVGDSVALFLGPEFQQIHTHPRLAVFDAGLQGCSLLSDVTETRHDNAFARTTIQPSAPCDPVWLTDAVKGFSPNVVFSIVGNSANAVFYRHKWVATCSPLYTSLYEQSLRSEIAILGVRGAHVVVVTSAYPRYLLAQEDKPTDCDNALRRKVAAETGTQLVDLFSYVCPHGKCIDKQTGLTLRPDGEHYQGLGGQIVAKWLIDQVPTTEALK